MKQFWQQVDRGEPDECWEWQGTRPNDAYGMVKFQPYRNEGAHRVAFKLDTGEDAPEYVCHTCGNKACVNPGHLYAGSAEDNMRDASEAGKLGSAKGETNGGSKLTADDVVAIRSKYKDGDVTQYDLAADYGVSQVSVGKIIRRETWAHI